MSAINVNEPSKIETLFEEWKGHLNASYGPEEQCEKAVNEMLRVENQMSREPITSVRDFAMVIAAYTTWGDFALPEDKQHPFWEQTRGMIEGEAV